MTYVEYSIWYHNWVDGRAPLEKQLAQAEYLVKAIKGLIRLERQGAIEITEGDSHPSIVRWDVKDEDAYKEAQEEFDLPDPIVWEEEDEPQGAMPPHGN